MSWKAEHGLDFEVPGAILHLVKKGVLKDFSWHNDVAPSFGLALPDRDDYGLRIWVDHPIKSLRETMGLRYLVQEGEFGSEADFEEATDDLEEALRLFFGRLAKYAPDYPDIEDPDYALEQLVEAWRKEKL